MNIHTLLGTSLRRKVVSILPGTLLALLTISLAPAATVTFDGGTAGTGNALDTAVNWVGNALPVTASEVLLDNSVITLPSQLTTTATSLTWGDLIWNSNTSSAITIDTASVTSRTITLSGGAGSTEAIARGGASGDLIVLGSAALTNTLSIGGNAGVGTGRLNLVLGAGGNFNVVNSGAALNISSIISGAFSLNKTGAGTLTLSGTSTFGSATNNFTLTAGTVNINAAAALGAAANTFIINGGTIDNTSGATLTTSAYKQTWNSDFVFTGTNNLSLGTGAVSLGTTAGTSRTVTVNGSTLTVGGIISNGTTANSIVKTGAGTLTLTGVNTFSGGVTIKSGPAIVGANAGFGTGTITLGDTGGSSNASLLGNLITTTLTATNPITVASGSTGNTLTIGSVAGGTTATTFSGAISLGHDLVVSNPTNNITTLSGVITETGGARAITVNAGSGTVVISNNNVFSGGLTLNSGRLQVGALNSAGGGVFTITGGSLDNASGAVPAVLNNSSYAWNGDFSFKGMLAVTMATGNVVLGGNRVVTTTNINSVSSSALIVSGGIGDGGSGYSLTKKGVGALTLNGASTYSGATVLQEGILNLTAATSTLANTSAVTISGGTLNLGVTSGTGVANRINPATTLTLGGNGIFSLNAGASGPANSQNFAALSVAAGSAQLSTTSATNAGTFAFTGAAGSVYTRALGGTLRIVVGTNTSFTNAPTGSSTMGSGASAILIGAVMGTTATTTASTDFVKAAAGVVSAPSYGTNIWDSGVNTDVTQPLSVTGATQSLRFNSVGNHTITLTGTATIESGGLLLTSNAVAGGILSGGTLRAASGKDLWIYTSTVATSPRGLIIHSPIADNGGSSLTKSGGGSLFLTNAGNTYAGGTYLNEGTLNVTSGEVLGTGALNFAGTAILQAGAANVNLGSRSVTIATGQMATFDSNGSANTITVAGVISGSGGLTKTGLGTLTLTGSNTYTGPTTINGGTLKLDFSAPGAPFADIINSSSTFSPGGGNFLSSGAFSSTVLIQGKDATANSQTFGGTYTNVLGNPEATGTLLNRGTTHLNLVAGASGGTLVVNMGAISRGYSTDVNNFLDINMGTGVTVTTTNATGLLGSYATVNGNTWATVSGGTVIGVADATYLTSYSSSGALLDVGTGGTLTVNPNSLRFNNNSAATVNPGTGVVRDLVAGGILVTSAVGANTSTIGSGVLAGYSARDLMIHQNNTAGDLQIDASIVDLGARTTTISKDGQGKLILTAVNTTTGSTYVNEGTLVVTGDAVTSFTKTATSTASNAVLTMSDTGGIFLGQSVTQATALTTASVTWSVVAIDPGVSVTLSNTAPVGLAGGTFTFGAGGGLGASASAIHYVAPGATLQIGNGGTTGSLIAGQPITNNGSVILNRSNDFTFSNVVSGIGALEKQGAGTVTLGATNTFTGDTRIAGGSLVLSLVGNLQSSTLDYNSYGGTLSFGALTTASLGGLKGGQNLTLNNASAAAVTLTVGGNHQDTTYSGTLSGLGALSKTGGSTLTLNGTMSYAGTTTVTQGTLNLAGTSSDVGAITLTNGVLNVSGSYTRTTYLNASALNVNGGVFNVTGTLGTSAAIPLGTTGFSGNSVSNFSGTEYLSGLSGTFRIGEGSSATVNVTAGSLTIGTSSAGLVLGRNNPSASGVLNVSGGSVIVAGNSVVRLGAGYVDTESGGASVMTLSGSGIFNTGTTTGAFLLGSNLAGNTTGTGTIHLDGGVLAINRAITGGTVGASVFNFNGGTFKANGTVATLGTTIGTANVRDGGAVFDTNGFNMAVAKALTHSNIAGDGATDGGLTKNGIGTLTLSGSNTYTGPTTVTAGTLKAGIATTGANGAFGNNSAVTLSDVAGAALDLTGFNNTIGSLAGGGALGGNVTLGAATLTVGGNNVSTIYGGIISGASGALVKNGIGTLALTGVNAYTGTTTVSAGNLQVGVAGIGSLNASSAVSINGSTARLSGTGTVNGSVTLTQGQLLPGDSSGASTGALHLNTLVFLPGSTTTVATLQITGSTASMDLDSDRIHVIGGLTISSLGNIVVDGTGYNAAAGDLFNLLDWGSLTPGGFSAGSNRAGGLDGNLDLPLLVGFEWNVSQFLVNGTLSVVAVPEPGRAVLLCLGIGGLALRRRRTA